MKTKVMAVLVAVLASVQVASATVARYTVTHRLDGRDVIVYRGPDEALAWRILRLYRAWGCNAALVGHVIQTPSK